MTNRLNKPSFFIESSNVIGTCTLLMTSCVLTYMLCIYIYTKLVGKIVRFNQVYWVSFTLSACLLVYVYVLHTSFPRLGTIWPKHLDLCQIPVVMRKRERHGKNGDSYIDMCPNYHLKIEMVTEKTMINFSWTLCINCMEVFEENAHHENRSFCFFYISSFSYQAMSLKVGNAF